MLFDTRSSIAVVEKSRGVGPMENEFPAAVPEIPVTDMTAALDYYANKLGFSIDWGGVDG